MYVVNLSVSLRVYINPLFCTLFVLQGNPSPVLLILPFHILGRAFPQILPLHPLVRTFNLCMHRYVILKFAYW